jgi:hypothetical protein
VHAVLLILQFARPHGREDFVLGQAKFFAGRLVAQRGTLLFPSSLQTPPSSFLPLTDPASTLHLFDNPEHSGTSQGVVGNAHCSERETFLIRVWVLSAYDGPHFVDGATVVVVQKRARLLASRVRPALLIGVQVRFNEFGAWHTQIPGNPLDVLIVELDGHGFAAIGATSAIHDLEDSLMQFTGKLVWIIAVVSELQAAEKFVVLIVVLLSTPMPLLDYRVVIHTVFLFAATIANDLCAITRPGLP